MLGLLYGSLVSRLLAVVAELGVADLVAGGPRSVDDLAVATRTDAGALYRVLRTLAGVGVFTEVVPRSFGLTPLAGTLRSHAVDSMRDMARELGSDEMYRSLAALPHSVRTGRPAFDHVYGTDVWSYRAAHPEVARVFNDAMGELARQVHAAAVETYDLSGVKRLVDVGGGHGHLMATVLRRYPHLTGVVFDRPHVVPDAAPVLAAAGVADRVNLVGGDFRTEVPAADAYLLSMVLHTCDDAEARDVLAAVRRAMHPAGRVVVVEALIPEGDTPHDGKMIDIIMLTLLTGRERTEAEFAALFSAAGLRLVETRPMPTLTSVIVAEPAA